MNKVDRARPDPLGNPMIRYIRELRAISNPVPLQNLRAGLTQITLGLIFGSSNRRLGFTRLKAAVGFEAFWVSI
jgi:hypothetical protein